MSGRSASFRNRDKKGERLYDRPKSIIPVYAGIVLFSSGCGGDRTHDRWLKRPLLYRLSYAPGFISETKEFYRFSVCASTGACRLWYTVFDREGFFFVS